MLFKVLGSLIAIVLNCYTPAWAADNAVALRGGYFLFNQAGLKNRTVSNVTNLDLQWAYYPVKDMAALFGMRLANDSDLGRVAYQAGYTGFRYYPLTLGAPVEGVVQFNRIEYNFTFRPYVQVGLGLGRVTLQTLAELNAADVGSEFVGFIAAAGTHIHITRQLAFDLSATFENNQGFSVVAYSANNILMQGGLQYFF